jgi:hypothetical protein
MSDSNDPSRLEFIKYTLELEIEEIKAKKVAGKPVSHDYYIKFLKKIKRQFLGNKFKDSNKIKAAINKAKAENIKHGRKGVGGLKRGSERKTTQSVGFDRFREVYPNSRHFSDYTEFCKATEISITKRYTPQSFAEKIGREEKRKRVIT